MAISGLDTEFWWLHLNIPVRRGRAADDLASFE